MDDADGGSDRDGKANCFDSRVIEYRHSLWNPDSTGYAFCVLWPSFGNGVKEEPENCGKKFILLKKKRSA